MDDLLFQYVPVPIFALDASGRIIEANEAACELSGYSRDSLISMRPAQLFTPSIPPAPETQSAPDTQLLYTKLRHRSGNIIPLRVSCRWRDIRGQMHALLSCQPLPEQNKLERDAGSSVEIYARVFHTSPDPILITEYETGKIRDLNPAFSNFFGYSRNEAIGLTTLELGIWPSNEDRIINLSNLKNTGYIHNHEISLRLRQGKIVTMLASTTLLTLDNTVHLVSHLRDISLRKEMETVLSDSEARYRQFADQLPLGVVITQDGMLKYVNESTVIMMQYSRNELEGSPFLSFIHEPDRARVTDNHRKRMAGEQIESPYQVALVRKSGEVRQCKLYASTITWGGKPSGLGVIADITDSLLYEAMLQHSIQQLQEKEKAKTRFLAAASHDLRQPLHAMGLFVSTLQDRALDTGTRKLVQQLDASTDALRALLNSLLDISRLDAGVIHAKNQHCAMQDMFDRLAHDFYPVATEKKISLRFTTQPYWVNCDSSLLEQILRNLLSNALRYTHKGGVLAGFRRRGNTLRIEVWDTGIGIPANELKNIFQEFYQVENPERDRTQGLGLGLAIAQRTANLLGLHIEVNSSVGKGSVFSIAVPLGKMEHETASQPVSPQHNQFDSALVVVIDDELAIREATGMMLENWGCEVLLADSQDRMFELLAQHQRSPSAIIADYRLRNNKTGAEAIRSLHQHYHAGIPAIIVTGDTDPARIREANESGYHLLHKPLAPAKLRTLLGHLLNG